MSKIDSKELIDIKKCTECKYYQIVTAQEKTVNEALVQLKGVYKKLNNLAENENCNVNQIVSRIIKYYEKNKS